MVSRAFAASTSSAVALIAEITPSDQGARRPNSRAIFEQHPDAAIYRSLPRLGVVLGARVLGEFGDDPERYESAKFAAAQIRTCPLGHPLLP